MLRSESLLQEGLAQKHSIAPVCIHNQDISPISGRQSTAASAQHLMQNNMCACRKGSKEHSAQYSTGCDLK